MMKTTSTRILTGILLTFAAAGASAQTALRQLGAEAGVDASAMVLQMKNVRAMDAGPETAAAPTQPLKDVLEGCSALQARAILPWNISQAVVMTQTCLNHAYAADGDFQVVAQASRFGKRACPEGPSSCMALVETIGIKIVVTGRLAESDTVLEDLAGTLQLHGGKLFGYDALVENQTSPN